MCVQIELRNKLLICRLCLVTDFKLSLQNVQRSAEHVMPELQLNCFFYSMFRTRITIEIHWNDITYTFSYSSLD